MGLLKNKLLGLIDNGAIEAKNFIENFNDVVNSFDINSQIDFLNEKKKEILKKSNELFSDFADLLKQVKENLTDFTVTVAFDESIGEKLAYEVKDNKLFIEVQYEDETTSRYNKTSVVIPPNCDLENISLDVNSTMKTATVTIPKMVIEPKREEAASTENQEETVREQSVEEDAEWKTEEPTSSSEESMIHTEEINEAAPSRLAQRLSRNGERYSQMLRRDVNGRFVRRTPNQEGE